MKNFKKLLTLLCLVTIVFTMLTGCDKKVEMVRANSAEEVLNLFNTYNSENNVEEMVKLYSNAYINYIEDINDNLKKAIVNISAVINGEETNEDYEYALIKEENGWSISPDGIIDCVEFDVPANEDKQLNLRLIKEGVMFNGALIRVNLYNNTNNTYTFGTEDGKAHIIVEASEGAFTSEVVEPEKIDKKVKSYFIANIQDLKGDIKKVTVTSIYDLDSDGNPLKDSKREIIVYNNYWYLYFLH